VQTADDGALLGDNRKEGAALLDPESGIDRMVKGFFHNEFLKIPIFIALLALFAVGIYGGTLVEDGLPLSDIVPKSSEASRFLRK